MSQPHIDTLIADLQSVWYEQIPLSAAMEVAVESFDNDVLVVAADLAPNINLHGTGFAGSLYAINALCGWSMVHLQMQLRGIEGSIVLADARMHYAKPVKERIVSVCDFGEQLSAFERLSEAGKTRFTLKAEISAKGEPAATFEGDYAVLLPRPK